MSSAKCLNLNKPEILSSGKDLTLFQFLSSDNIILVLEYVEDTMENKAENAGYLHFHFFLQCCEKLSFSRLVKSELFDKS